MIDPGALKRRLVLEAPAETPDGAGGVVRSFTTLAVLWAEVTPVGARADEVAAAAGATVTHRIVIRTGPVLTTRHRFRDGVRIYRIAAIREREGPGRFLEIDAEERIS